MARVYSKQLLFLAVQSALAGSAGATVYNDAIGDHVGPQTNPPNYVDISSVSVTNDAANVNFQININSSADLTDPNQQFADYEIGFQTAGPGVGNTAITTPFNNEIGISSGMNFWAGAFPRAAGSGFQLYQWDSTNNVFAQVGGNNPLPFTSTSMTVSVPLAALGLSVGNSFKFDVWSTFGSPGGQSAYDALDNPNFAAGAGVPYTGGSLPETAYDAATATGSTFNSTIYTIVGAAAASQWTGATDNTWSNSGNWNGPVPNGADQIANFGSLTSGNFSVAIDGGAKTVGAINFDSATSYTIGTTAGNGISLQVSTGQAGINVVSGNHTIAAPVTLLSNTTMNIASGSTLKLTGNLTAAGQTVTSSGAGTVQVNNVRAAGLNVGSGAFQVVAGTSANSAAGASMVGTLSITTGAALDLTNNGLIVNYTTLGTLLGDTRQELLSGQLRTTLNTGGHALGYADNASLGRTTFAGQSVGSNSLLVAYTFAGDANLDGKVNASDFDALAAHYGNGSSAVWVQGDFNYDGVVNVLDFNAMAGNYNKTMPSPSVALGTLVPEPTIGFLAAITLALGGTRRRRSP